MSLLRSRVANGGLGALAGIALSCAALAGCDSNNSATVSPPDARSDARADATGDAVEDTAGDAVEDTAGDAVEDTAGDAVEDTDRPTETRDDGSDALPEVEGPCPGGGEPQDELCDGRDNDCDGETDEDFAYEGLAIGAACQGMGACGDGVVECVRGARDLATCSSNPNGSASQAQPELCDTLDNDCDGSVNEGLDDVAQSDCADLGVCAQHRGTIVASCTAAGTWSCDYSAVLAYEASETRCDALDNDCDGDTDEGLTWTEPGGVKRALGAGCDGADADACANGVVRCANDAVGTECIETGAAHAELCDGVDNDCDGETDEDFGDTAAGRVRLADALLAGDNGLTLGQACGAGACAGGVVVCGSVGALKCSTDVRTTTSPGTPAELCDGIDNDCDGATDEDFLAAGRFTLSRALLAADNGKTKGDACGAGECAGGTVVCGTVSTLVCSTDAIGRRSNGSAKDDTCNGKDDDCDGQVDNDFVAAASAARKALTGALYAADNGKAKGADCGVGECIKDPQSGAASGGKVVCSADETRLLCSSDARSQSELCDDLDNDCNGIADDPFRSGQAAKLVGAKLAADNGKPKGAACGTGACVASAPGVVVCAADKAQLACDSDARAASEICDAIDNDCDGTADEGFSYQGAAVGGACDGIGACGHGKVMCLDAATTTCSTNPNGSESGVSAEVCDGQDNDCNGTTDEGFSFEGAAIGLACNGIGACDVGVVECAGPTSATCSTNPDGTTPQAGIEICDGKDNDCDGVIDDACIVACATESSEAFCARLGKTCGLVTGVDNCGNTRTRRCGGCADDSFCGAEGHCLPACGNLEQTGCCDGSLVFSCVNDSVIASRCASEADCGWQPWETYFCGGSGEDPSGNNPIGCDNFEFKRPACIPETNEDFCARTGAVCGAPVFLDNCGQRRYRVDCGTCPDPGQTCNRLGECTTCGNNVLEFDEVCDDGDTIDDAICLGNCQLPGHICYNDCFSADDGHCDDVGYGSETDNCNYGSDCDDCGIRRDEPCWEYPPGGTCVFPYYGELALACELFPGASYPGLVVNFCGPTELCTVGNGPGDDACMLAPVFECEAGASTCDGQTLRQCDINGMWQDTACSGACVPFALGSYCQPANSQTVSGQITYEHRLVNDDLTDWGDLETLPLGSALLVAYELDPVNGYSVFDVALSEPDGNYTIALPSTPSAEDLVAIYLVGLDDQGAIAFTIANPDFPDAPTQMNPGAEADVVDWSWPWYYTFGALDLVADPDVFISDANGSGQVRVFDMLREIYDTTHSLAGRRGESIAIWMQPGITWSCGACAAPIKSRMSTHRFTSNVWLGYSADEQYWSDAVTAHELGHWVMSSFGTSPGEGGPHAVSRPALPGLAYSEGFATFFSSLMRSDDRYYDKQFGSFFWFDLRAMVYPFGGQFYPFVLPTANGIGYPDPDDPVLQQIDENLVAAMLYAMAIEIGNPPAAPSLASDGQLFMDALTSPRTNLIRLDPARRFPRGYVRHVWDLDPAYFPTDIQALPYYSAPMLADYIDGLRCLPGQDLDPIIEQAILTYPYPIDEPPICEPAPESPLTMTLTGPEKAVAGKELTLRLEIRRPAPNAVPMTVKLELPKGVTLVGKSRELIVDATSQLITRDYRLRVARVPRQDLNVVLDARTTAMGVHATASYRFGRPAPKARPVPLGPTMRGPGGLLIGKPVQVRR